MSAGTAATSPTRAACQAAKGEGRVGFGQTQSRKDSKYNQVTIFDYDVIL